MLARVNQQSEVSNNISNLEYYYYSRCLSHVWNLPRLGYLDTPSLGWLSNIKITEMTVILLELKQQHIAVKLFY